MPLPLPDLDNRRWADLVDEARAIIPRHAPAWTDHNAHDPGIMLVELFAWLTEQGIYRLNQVPDRHKRKFLRLVGFDPEPPRAARAIVAFHPKAGASTFALPAGFDLASAPHDEARVRFRTLAPVEVVDVEVAALKVDEGDGTVRDRTLDWHDGLSVAPFGQNPAPGGSLYLGFESLPAGPAIRLGFRLKGPGNDVEERSRLRDEAAAQHAACRPAKPGWPCDGDVAPRDSAAPELPPHHSARTAWEFWNGTSWSPLAQAPTAALAEGQVHDDTRSLTLDGVVALRLPSTLAPTNALGDDPALFYLRCQLVAGHHDTPPELVALAPNAVWVEQAVPASRTYPIPATVTPAGTAPANGSTARPRMTLDAKGVIQALAFDAASEGPEIPVWSYVPPDPEHGTAGSITMELVVVGRGTGLPGQGARLPGAPIVLRGLRLFSLTADVWQEWTPRDDLDASRRTDRDFVADPETGEVAFGDGEQGRNPEAGALLLAHYRVTAAASGNLHTGARLHPGAKPRNTAAFETLPEGVISKVTLLNPSLGGADAESIPHASGRAVNTLHAHERLVDLCEQTRNESLDQIRPARVRSLEAPARAANLIDIERLALDVPGTRVGRARAWAQRHPDFPCVRVPGTVTVVILPDAPGPRPVPSRGLLHAVRRALQLRRVVCTRVEVVGPTYREVSVRGRVACEPLVDPARLAAAIRAALDAFLNPLTGGAEGRGWPFGRDVYRSEILQVVHDVPGVDYVSSLSLELDGRETACGNLTLCSTELVTAGTHAIEVAAP